MALYLGTELNIGNYLGIDLNLNYVHLEKYSLRVAYSANIRKANSLPADYSSGLIGAMLFGLTTPVDQMENLQIGLGRIYGLNPNRTIRANISLGLGFTTIREPENWQVTESSLLVENYSWEYGKYNTLSLIINPKIEFAFNRFYGFTLSPMLQLSKERMYIGVGIGQIMGLVRNKVKSAPKENISSSH